jgi:protein SCO1/2
MARPWGAAVIRCCALLFLAACGAVPGAACATDRTTSAIDPAQFSYDERPGARLPSQLLFQDSDGRVVRLGDLAHGAPLILVPAYLQCPNLCSVVRASLLGSLQRAELLGGRDYVLAVLSIDATETSAEASAAKAADLSAFGHGQSGSYWHYLTGAAPNITAVTNAVGFRNRFDPDAQQFVHPAGIVFVTPEGVVSGYLLGVGYTPTDVRIALHTAGMGRVAAAAAPLLLICFHFDPTTGRYSLAVMKLLRLGGVLTALTIAGMLFLLYRRERIRS